MIAYTFTHTHTLFVDQVYIGSSIVIDDGSLEIPVYNLVQCDHSSSTKRGGVCLDYKSYLLLKVLKLKHLQECLNIEFSIGKKIYKLILLYRSLTTKPRRI